MTSFAGLADLGVIAELGRRARAERLNKNLTQAVVAERAGLSRQTVAAIERGEDASLSSFVAVVRALGHLDGFDPLLAEAPPSPIEALRRSGATRQRASGSAGERSDAGAFEWGDGR